MAKTTFTEIKPVKLPLLDSQVVTDILLQRHRSLLSRLMTVRDLGRFLNFVVLIVLAVTSFSLPRSVAFVLVSFFVGACWIVERRWVVAEISMIERTLAKHSGDQLEDLFIQAKFHAAELSSGFLDQLFKKEHWLWSFLIFLFAIVRYLGK